MIVTDVTAFKEIGVKDGENGFILDFDMKKVNVKRIYESKLKFDYEPPKDNYGKIFAKGKNIYLEGFKKKALVEAKISPFYYDVELKENVRQGTRFVVNKNRAEDLVDKGLVNFIKDIDE